MAKVKNRSLDLKEVVLIGVKTPIDNINYPEDTNVNDKNVILFKN